MALVTRCPYCGAVWLLADRQTAEQGPVRCSACRNSFDATREMMLVADAMFPNLPKPSHAVAATPEADRSSIVEPAPAQPEPGEQPMRLQPFVGHAEPLRAVTPPIEPLPRLQPHAAGDSLSAEPVTEPEKPRESGAAPAPVPPPQPAPPVAEPKPEKTADEPAEPALVKTEEAKPAPVAVQSAATNEKTEPAAQTQPQTVPVTPVRPDERCEPHLPGRVPAAGGTMQRTSDIQQIIPAQNNRRPTVVRSVARRQEKRKTKTGSGWSSFLLLVLLLIILAGIGAVAVNQKIMDAFPQTRPVFDELCGRIPCPGYFLRDPSAFVVSKTTLRNVDESGNYALEITIINGSNVAQGVPYLELELLDDDNGVLLKKTMSPDDYLKDPSATKSLAPNRSLSIRVTLQTNVTPARCTVRAVYPNN